ncbi:hypothetical protein STCU_12126 [Strigomonas culicis]|uniref:Uncharacterized protein n=1 Tax=Strigomonas culicis TaxID=28005 RepID=S9UKW0_9TRYP|nr:hypothetical protein STCU_12126 [Strigomonas culicis]|eukprot:EPY15316.1 hypothetical protein STCU_12126 [Strigomonas culicis]
MRTPQKGLHARSNSRPLGSTPLSVKKLENNDTEYNESQARRKAMLARIQNTLTEVSKTHSRVYGEVAEIRRSYACTATQSHVGSDDDEDEEVGNTSFATAPPAMKRTAA